MHRGGNKIIFIFEIKFKYSLQTARRELERIQMGEDEALYLPTEDEKRVLEDVKENIQEHRQNSKSFGSLAAIRRKQHSKGIHKGCTAIILDPFPVGKKSRMIRNG